MAGEGGAESLWRRTGDMVIRVLVTLLCWAWFIGGFILIFSWAYLAVTLLAKDRQRGFQRLNHYFFRVFFFILRNIARRQSISIDPRIVEIRSSVVICNHLSYLDPLFLVAIFPRHRTIVKTRFFSTPIFGAMIKRSGYIPATVEGNHAACFLEAMESLPGFLASGGNLFIFPEGTRSRDGRLGPLQPGALKIARRCRAPITILHLQNTDKLFTPGKFLFHAHHRNRIAIDLLTRIDPEHGGSQLTVSELEERVRHAFVAEQ